MAGWPTWKVWIDESLVRGRATPLQAILLDLPANFGIDLSSTDTLLGLVAEAEKTKTEVLFAEVQDPVHQMFRRCRLLDRVGENRLFLTLDDAVHDYLDRHPAANHAGRDDYFLPALRSG